MVLINLDTFIFYVLPYVVFTLQDHFVMLIEHGEPPRKTVQPQELTGNGLGCIIRKFSLG
jgi:hypothetical protein